MPLHRIAMYIAVPVCVVAFVLAFFTAMLKIDQMGNQSCMESSVRISPDRKCVEIDMHDGRKLVVEAQSIKEVPR